MRRFVLLFITYHISFSAFLFAQHIEKGPELHPDLMTYFQNEMASLRHFELTQMGGDTVPFYLGGRIKGTTNKTYIDSQSGTGTNASIYYDYEKMASNQIANAIGGFQIKLGDNLNIPFFALITNYDIEGIPDEGSIKSINGIPVDSSWYKRFWYSERKTCYFFGSGLIFRNEISNFGVFAGYYMEDHSFFYNGSQMPQKPYGDNVNHKHEEEKHTDSFKIALLPEFNTSDWEYIGNILNRILGYIGLGNSVQIYTGEKEESDSEKITGLLNWGLNLCFNKFYLGSFSLEPKFYSVRQNYDAIAKNDIFGLSLTGIFTKAKNMPKIELDFGYRNFYSVSKYFISHYQNTWFIDAGISFLFNDMFFKSSLHFNYKYDEVKNHQFVVSYSMFRLADYIVELGVGVKKLFETEINNEKHYVNESSLSGGFGIRLRVPTSSIINDEEGW